MNPERREELNDLIRQGLLMMPNVALVDMIMEGITDLTEPELEEFVDQLNEPLDPELLEPGIVDNDHPAV